jgi:CubicO group peptidase (beta-lactamase class C family)
MSENYEAFIQTVQTANAAVQTVLELASQLKLEADENKWVSPEEAIAALGSGISRKMLVDRIKDGRFRHGVHYIDSSDGPRANYLFRVASVRKFFETPPEKRPLPKNS